MTIPALALSLPQLELELKGPRHDAVLAADNDKIVEDAERQTSPLAPEPTSDLSYRGDGGWTAWLCVVVGFFQLIVSLGLGFSFGVYQAHYHLVAFPAASNSVRASIFHALRKLAVSRLKARPLQAISFVGSSGYASLIFGSLLAGRFTEVYGPRWCTLLGAIMSAVGLIAAGSCRSVPALILTQGQRPAENETKHQAEMVPAGIITGLGAGFIITAALSLPVIWFVKRRSLAFGIVNSGTGAG